MGCGSGVSYVTKNLTWGSETVISSWKSPDDNAATVGVTGTKHFPQLRDGPFLAVGTGVNMELMWRCKGPERLNSETSMVVLLHAEAARQINSQCHHGTVEKVAIVGIETLHAVLAQGV